MEFNRVNGEHLKLVNHQCCHLSPTEGNLALSRALGDFEFKKNKDFPAEEQVVTG